MKGFPDLPPIWLLGALILAWLLALWLPIAAFGGPVWRLIGQGLAGLGLALIFWAAFWFRRKKTTIEPHHEPTALITDGPFQFSRSPIYLGFVLILTGAVLWHGAVSGLLLPPLLLLVLHHRFVRPETAGILATFGPEGAAWVARVRPWL